MALTGPNLLGLAAALALFGLASLLLGLRNGSGPARILGLFAGIWGLQQLFLRLASVVGPGDTGTLLVMFAQAAVMPLYLLLMHFAVVFPTRLRVADARWWLPVLTLPGALALLLAIADFRTILDIGAREGQPLFGWGTILLTFIPLMTAQTLALVRFVRGYIRAASKQTAAQFRWGLIGLSPYLAYQTVYLFRDVPSLGSALGPLGTAIFAAALASVAVITAGCAAQLIIRSSGRSRLWWAALFTIPVSLAWLLHPAEVYGAFRLILVGGLGYAVAKFQLFDLDLRLRSAVRPWVTGVFAMAMAGLAASVAGVTSSGLVSGNRLEPSIASFVGFAALVGLALGGIAARPLSRILERQFPYLRATDEYLLRRRYEVYRAGLDRGLPPVELEALAKDLRLRPWERNVLLRIRSDGASLTSTNARLAGRYRLSSFLGPGMYGRVFLAEDERVGEPVVLKEYAGFGGTAAAEGFAREAKTLGALDHRNVLAVRDVFRAGDDMYIALEHAPDGNLEDRLAKGPLPEEEALDLTRQVLAGLAAAHKKDIVHRDVKPSNVLFKGKTLKLADFGVAFDPVFDGAMRAAAAQPGTLAWMAPEQALGKGAGKSSDAYAAGAILYRMLAGRHYLHLANKGEHAVRRAIAERPPALPLPGASDHVNAVLAKALAKDPAERYADAGAMLRDLKAPWRPTLARAAGRPAAGRAYGAP